MKKQNDAVFDEVCAVLGQSSFADKVQLSSSEKSSVIKSIVSQILNGDVAFSDEAKQKHDTYEKISKYVRGMIDNHLRKDKRLNGGAKYATKNTGHKSEADEELRQLKQLASQTHDPQAKKAVLEEIEERKALFEKQKLLKSIKIDVDGIPDNLKHLVD